MKSKILSLRHLGEHGQMMFEESFLYCGTDRKTYNMLLFFESFQGEKEIIQNTSLVNLMIESILTEHL